MSRRRLISICIPAYNEAENLPVAIERVEKLFTSNLSQYDFEIVITDNASTDSSWETIQEISKVKKNVRAFRFSRNFGYQNSVFAGLSLAKGDAVVELDADLEDPPEVILEFIRGWESGYHVVFGVRTKRHTFWILKLLFSLFYKVLNRVSDLPIPANAGDFRLMDRQVVDVLVRLPERNLYLRGLVSYLGFRQLPVYYERDPRLSGKSKFRFFQYAAMAVDALTAFSKTPLRIFGVIGVGLFLITLLIAIRYLIAYWINGVPVAGFTTLVVLMLGLHSVTFMFLAVLGEYLSRIFDDSKFRPRVIIAESTDSEFPRTL